MTIRVAPEELNEFNASLKKIKNNVEELCFAVDKIMNKVVIENMLTGSALISDIEKLSVDIYKLKDEIECYIYDINILIDEFKNIDNKLKDDTIELKNLISEVLRKSKNSFVPATYSINSSINSEGNEKVMSLYGVDSKTNQTVELSRYNDL